MDFQQMNSGFILQRDSRFQCPVFRIPQAKISWIPESGLPYMRRKFGKCGILLADGAFNSSLSTLLVVINFFKFCVCSSLIGQLYSYVYRALFLSLNICRSLCERKALLIRILKTLFISSVETFIDTDGGLNSN